MKGGRWLVGLVIPVLLLVLAVAPGSASPLGVPWPPAGGDSAAASQVGRLPAVPISSLPMKGQHLVRPREEVVLNWLREDGLITADSSEDAVRAEVDRFYQGFEKQSVTWVSPEAKERALKREAELTQAGVSAQAIQPITAKVLALAVDFGGTDTFTVDATDNQGNCVSRSITRTGPRNGLIPQPGTRDNNTIWYTPQQTADAAFYEKLIFGHEGVGRVRMDLIDPVDHQPGVNLAGYTVQDYYDQVAGAGNVTLSGAVKGWVTVNHSEAYYGADVCSTGEHYGGGPVPVGQLAVDPAARFNQANPGFDWRPYDADHDGFVDTFWIIHAGMGQEAGGGIQGEDAIWSHSSDLRFYNQWANGYKVYEGNAGTTSDDIYLGPYTMQPENLDLGVLVEEFGHNFFALPDLYTTDLENSTGFWDMMASGSWTGYLGGAMPAGMPLWFRIIAQCGPNPCNWQEPMITRQYNDASQATVIGQLESTPNGVAKGVKVNLPSVTQSFPNEAGTGKAAWTDTGRDMVDLTLDRPVTIGATAAGQLTFDSYWDIEDSYDYGYLMAKVGSTWVYLHDLDGYFTNSNPAVNLGWGLTGSTNAKHPLRFDLSAYKGQTITLRFRYVTDLSVNGVGWWVDNLKLDGTTLDAFESATAPATFPGWTNSNPGWTVTPATRSYPSYYLLEWRGDSKYDHFLKTAYITSYSDADEWEVQRVPYSIPGALLYYRNALYSSTYTLSDNDFDPPSLGPKYQLLVVDMNWQPMRLTTPNGNITLSARAASYDATLTTQPTQAFTIQKYLGSQGTINGPWAFPAKAAVNRFDDSLGYYAGVYSGPPCPEDVYPDQPNFCWNTHGSSAVIPARGEYTTRVTHYDGTPFTSLYGFSSLLGVELGTGNPGDSDVELGVRLKLTGQSADGKTATIIFQPAGEINLPLVQSIP